MNHALNEFLSARMPGYLDMLRQMVAINSFTANAEGVNRLGELTASFFGQLGFEAEFVQSVNPEFGRHLFLQRPSAASGPTIAMISHLDTVFPPEEELANNFVFQLAGDRIYGPGCVDIKGGTVMMYMILEALSHLQPEIFERTKWLLGLDASEETLSEDFGELCRQRIPPGSLACLVLEGGTPNGEAFPLVTSRKGRAEFTISAEGRGAHAGNYHKQGANAIVQLSHAIARIAELTDYTQQLTFNVGHVAGGSVVNRVPHFAEARLEMRAFTPEAFETGLQRMQALNGFSSVASLDGFPSVVKVEQVSSSTPWPRNPATERLFDLWSAAAETLGQSVKPEARGGLSDGNLLWQHVPTLDGLGPAGGNAHCSERSVDGAKEPEYVLAPSFVPKAMLNIEAIILLCKSI
jgi:glutamate carboxypeptidase